MKKIALNFVLLIIFSQALWATVTVDGNAYLENQTNHDSIKVFVERIAPSSLNDSTYTDSNGYYSIDIETGLYNIIYSKDDYFNEFLTEQTLYSNTTLSDVTLLEHTTIINVPSMFTTIQGAINRAYENDTVLVATGTYVENIIYNGKNITVASLFLTNQDTSYISQTIIDGNQSGSVVTFNEGSANAVLSGFTIQNGSASDGGGIYCYLFSPSISNVTITGNSANSGGGIDCWSRSSPSLENVTISGNSASYRGGGIRCDWYSSPSLENVTITDNSASDNGGGIYCDYSSPSLLNTIVSDNTGNYGIHVESGNPSITYSDFYNNQNGNFYNCGQWVGVNLITNANGDSCDVYCNIQLDPLFLDAVNGDYHLSWSNYPVQDSTMSPCIDSGDPDSPLDPDGTVADMGAYYFHHTIVLDPPQNVTIEIIGTDVHINWDAVMGANSYKVYASDDPYTGFDSLATVTDTTWSTSITEMKEFYYVKASTETIRYKDSNSQDVYRPGRKLRRYDSNKFMKRRRK